MTGKRPKSFGTSTSSMTSLKSQIWAASIGGASSVKATAPATHPRIPRVYGQNRCPTSRGDNARACATTPESPSIVPIARRTIRESKPVSFVVFRPVERPRRSHVWLRLGVRRRQLQLRDELLLPPFLLPLLLPPFLLPLSWCVDPQAGTQSRKTPIDLPLPRRVF